MLSGVRDLVEGGVIVLVRVDITSVRSQSKIFRKNHVVQRDGLIKIEEAKIADNNF